MSGPSAKGEQALRRDVLRNEQQSKLRPGGHEPSTMHAMSRLSNDLEGRQSARDYVVGEAESVSYPAIPSGPWSSNYARLPDEPALGWSVEAQEANGTPAEVTASLPAPLTGKVEGDCAVAPVATSSTTFNQQRFGGKRPSAEGGADC